MRKAPILASILSLTLLSCVPLAGGHPLLTTQSAGCSSLIPEAWGHPVEAPPLPDGTAGGLAAFADAVLGRLDQANDRTSAAIGIVARCEARDAAAIRRATRLGLLGRLFGS